MSSVYQLSAGGMLNMMYGEPPRPSRSGDVLSAFADLDCDDIVRMEEGGLLDANAVEALTAPVSPMRYTTVEGRTGGRGTSVEAVFGSLSPPHLERQYAGEIITGHPNYVDVESMAPPRGFTPPLVTRSGMVYGSCPYVPTELTNVFGNRYVP